ncbi:unnamed protein product [Bursaphelenchus okinawaensis]|uniref:Uncharacterized protein n=1 Tax=Bursaphelenchus okinawaensis TaxID=465554 RepID=A0A811LRQ6_9BILA|nr:unnamed protein product [Bursaphelenchus okinawaensis]CAG9127469.1 unnamed protein product [Bursaphelenchus okinawaensis]
MRLALILASLALIRAEIWTEADESRRINQLKQEESRAFELQMHGANPFAGNPQSIYTSGSAGYSPRFGIT